jgi:hypothetical protein
MITSAVGGLSKRVPARLQLRTFDVRSLREVRLRAVARSKAMTETGAKRTSS